MSRDYARAYQNQEPCLWTGSVWFAVGFIFMGSVPHRVFIYKQKRLHSYSKFYPLTSSDIVN